MTETLELAKAIAEGQGDDREGWYGAVEAEVLARALLACARERQEERAKKHAMVEGLTRRALKAEAKLAACDRERQEAAQHARDMERAAAGMSADLTALGTELTERAEEAEAKLAECEAALAEVEPVAAKAQRYRDALPTEAELRRLREHINAYDWPREASTSGRGTWWRQHGQHIAGIVGRLEAARAALTESGQP